MVSTAKRDLTREFHAYASKLAVSRATGAPAKAAVLPAKTGFNDASTQLHRDILYVRNRLKHLSRYVEESGLRDEKRDDINSMTHELKEDIQNLTRRSADINKFASPKNSETQEHVQNVIKMLNQQLMDTGKQFKKVLELRTKKQQEIAEQGAKFGVINFPTASSANMAPLSLAAEAAANEENAWGKNSLLFGSSTPFSVEDEVRLDMPQQDQMQMTMYSNTSRLEDVRGIESALVSLQGIMGKLVTIVAEQGETIQRIDSNVEGTLVNVNSAQNELMKYWQSVNSNRGLMMKIFGVLAVTIVMFFVLFL